MTKASTVIVSRIGNRVIYWNANTLQTVLGGLRDERLANYHPKASLDTYSGEGAAKQSGTASSTHCEVGIGGNDSPTKRCGRAHIATQHDALDNQTYRRRYQSDAGEDSQRLITEAEDIKDKANHILEADTTS